MAELQVKFTDEERKFLSELLENALKDKAIEEHRTRAPSYRQGVIHQEDLIRSVLSKLQPPK